MNSFRRTLSRVRFFIHYFSFHTAWWHLDHWWASRFRAEHFLFWNNVSDQLQALLAKVKLSDAVWTRTSLCRHVSPHVVHQRVETRLYIYNYTALQHVGARDFNTLNLVWISVIKLRLTWSILVYREVLPSENVALRIIVTVPSGCLAGEARQRSRCGRNGLPHGFDVYLPRIATRSFAASESTHSSSLFEACHIIAAWCDRLIYI